MKKKLLFLWGICFLLFSFSTSSIAAGLTINGYDWEKWNRKEKLLFVMGWAKCGEHASDSLAFNVRKLNETKEFINLTEENFKDEGVLFGGVTIGQVVDTVSKIYSDPRVKNMDITDIMPFVSGRLIQGWTEKELDEVIAIDIKLKQCEAKGIMKECASERGERMSYLQKLKKK